MFGRLSLIRHEAVYSLLINKMSGFFEETTRTKKINKTEVPQWLKGETVMSWVP